MNPFGFGLKAGGEHPECPFEIQVFLRSLQADITPELEFGAQIEVNGVVDNSICNGLAC